MSSLAAGAVLTVASILVLFVVFAFSLYSLHYCLQYFAQESTSPSERRRRRARTARTRGVDPELLRSLPVTVYRAGAKEDDAALVMECAVCLSEMEDGEEARFLPRCGHGFHVECVDMWLASHVTCPLCRLAIAKPDDINIMVPVPRELANYDASNNLPASVLLGVSDHRRHGALAEETLSIDRGTTAVQMVVEIPESAAPTPRDVAKSPGSVSLRSIRSLWSFGRQGAGPSSSCSCSCTGNSEPADVEHDFGVTIGTSLADAQLPSEAPAGATR